MCGLIILLSCFFQNWKILSGSLLIRVWKNSVWNFHNRVSKFLSVFCNRTNKPLRVTVMKILTSKYFFSFIIFIINITHIHGFNVYNTVYREELSLLNTRSREAGPLKGHYSISYTNVMRYYGRNFINLGWTQP